MRHILSKTLILTVLALGTVAQAGCGADSVADEPPGSKTKHAGETASEAIPVEVVELGTGEIEAVLRFSTNLEAENEVQVFAEAAQRVERLLVEEGRQVAKGQLLLALEDEEQRTALTKAETQRDKAKREYDRQQRLFGQELISEQAMNEATWELDRLELEVETARQALARTEVHAPISGVVTKRSVGVGDYVTVHQHLFDLVDMDSIVARIYVPEKELARLTAGQSVRVVSPALGAAAYPGRVERISPVVDPASGTVKVTVDLPRRDDLRPGMYVDVELVAEVEGDALLVPKRALVYDDDQTYVFRVEGEGDDSVARRVRLTPRLEDKTNVAPAGGVAAGDRIVVAGQAGLKDGARVRTIDTARGGQDRTAK